MKNKCKNGMDFTRHVIGEKEYMIKYIPKWLSEDYDVRGKCLFLFLVTCSNCFRYFHLIHHKNVNFKTTIKSRI